MLLFGHDRIMTVTNFLEFISLDEETLEQKQVHYIDFISSSLHIQHIFVGPTLTHLTIS